MFSFVWHYDFLCSFQFFPSFHSISLDSWHLSVFVCFSTIQKIALTHFLLSFLFLYFFVSSLFLSFFYYLCSDYHLIVDMMTFFALFSDYFLNVAYIKDQL